jgi:glycosyltransferase involved in cell wall biosynthesis
VSSTSGRIGLVNDSKRFDGIYQGFLAARDVLRAAGVPVQVYSCIDPSIADAYVPEGVVLRGHRVPLGEFVERGVNRVFPVFTRPLRNAPVDVLHVSNVHLATATRFRKDVVITVADLAKKNTRYYSRTSSLAHNLLLKDVRKAAALVCHTEWARQDAARTLPFDPARIFLTGHYDPPASVDGTPRDRDPPTREAPWNLLYVAADRPHKNLPFFLRVLDAAGPRYRGTLISRLSPATERLAAPLVASGKLEVRAGVDDLVPIYDAADVLLFPSLYEGFGFPLLEAMSHALPILASDRTCVPEVVGDGGRCLPVGDPAAWVEALEALTLAGAYRDASERSRRRKSTFVPARTLAGLRAAYETARPH